MKDMETRRRDKINRLHADNDYAWKKICSIRVSKQKPERTHEAVKKYLPPKKTLSPKTQLSPHPISYIGLKKLHEIPTSHGKNHFMKLSPGEATDIQKGYATGIDKGSKEELPLKPKGKEIDSQKRGIPKSQKRKIKSIMPVGLGLRKADLKKPDVRKRLENFQRIIDMPTGVVDKQSSLRQKAKKGETLTDLKVDDASEDPDQLPEVKTEIISDKSCKKLVKNGIVRKISKDEIDKSAVKDQIYKAISQNGSEKEIELGENSKKLSRDKIGEKLPSVEKAKSVAAKAEEDGQDREHPSKLQQETKLPDSIESIRILGDSDLQTRSKEEFRHQESTDIFIERIPVDKSELEKSKSSSWIEKKYDEKDFGQSTLQSVLIELDKADQPLSLDQIRTISDILLETEMLPKSQEETDIYPVTGKSKSKPQGIPRKKIESPKTESAGSSEGKQEDVRVKTSRTTSDDLEKEQQELTLQNGEKDDILTDSIGLQNRSISSTKDAKLENFEDGRIKTFPSDHFPLDLQKRDIHSVSQSMIDKVDMMLESGPNLVAKSKSVPTEKTVEVQMKHPRLSSSLEDVEKIYHFEIGALPATEKEIPENFIHDTLKSVLDRVVCLDSGKTNLQFSDEDKKANLDNAKELSQLSKQKETVEDEPKQPQLEAVDIEDLDERSMKFSEGNISLDKYKSYKDDLQEQIAQDDSKDAIGKDLAQIQSDEDKIYLQKEVKDDSRQHLNKSKTSLKQQEVQERGTLLEKRHSREKDQTTDLESLEDVLCKKSSERSIKHPKQKKTVKDEPKKLELETSKTKSLSEEHSVTFPKKVYFADKHKSDKNISAEQVARDEIEDILGRVWSKIQSRDAVQENISKRKDLKEDSTQYLDKSKTSLKQQDDGKFLDKKYLRDKDGKIRSGDNLISEKMLPSYDVKEMRTKSGTTLEKMAQIKDKGSLEEAIPTDYDQPIDKKMGKYLKEKVPSQIESVSKEEISKDYDQKIREKDRTSLASEVSLKDKSSLKSGLLRDSDEKTQESKKSLKMDAASEHDQTCLHEHKTSKTTEKLSRDILIGKEKILERDIQDKDIKSSKSGVKEEKGIQDDDQRNLAKNLSLHSYKETQDEDPKTSLSDYDQKIQDVKQTSSMFSTSKQQKMQDDRKILDKKYSKEDDKKIQSEYDSTSEEKLTMYDVKEKRAASGTTLEKMAESKDKRSLEDAIPTDYDKPMDQKEEKYLKEKVPSKIESILKEEILKDYERKIQAKDKATLASEVSVKSKTSLKSSFSSDSDQKANEYKESLKMGATSKHDQTCLDEHKTSKTAEKLSREEILSQIESISKEEILKDYDQKIHERGKTTLASQVSIKDKASLKSGFSSDYSERTEEERKPLKRDATSKNDQTCLDEHKTSKTAAKLSRDILAGKEKKIEKDIQDKDIKSSKSKVKEKKGIQDDDHKVLTNYLSRDSYKETLKRDDTSEHDQTCQDEHKTSETAKKLSRDILGEEKKLERDIQDEDIKSSKSGVKEKKGIQDDDQKILTKYLSLDSYKDTQDKDPKISVRPFSSYPDQKDKYEKKSERDFKKMDKLYFKGRPTSEFEKAIHGKDHIILKKDLSKYYDYKIQDQEKISPVKSIQHKKKASLSKLFSRDRPEETLTHAISSKILKDYQERMVNLEGKSEEKEISKEFAEASKDRSKISSKDHQERMITLEGKSGEKDISKEFVEPSKDRSKISSKDHQKRMMNLEGKSEEKDISREFAETSEDRSKVPSKDYQEKMINLEGKCEEKDISKEFAEASKDKSKVSSKDYQEKMMNLEGKSKEKDISKEFTETSNYGSKVSSKDVLKDDIPIRTKPSSQKDFSSDLDQKVKTTDESDIFLNEGSQEDLSIQRLPEEDFSVDEKLSVDFIQSVDDKERHFLKKDMGEEDKITSEKKLSKESDQKTLKDEFSKELVQEKDELGKSISRQAVEKISDKHRKSKVMGKDKTYMEEIEDVNVTPFKSKDGHGVDRKSVDGGISREYIQKLPIKHSLSSKLSRDYSQEVDDVDKKSLEKVVSIDFDETIQDRDKIVSRNGIGQSYNQFVHDKDSRSLEGDASRADQPITDGEPVEVIISKDSAQKDDGKVKSQKQYEKEDEDVKYSDADVLRQTKQKRISEIPKFIPSSRSKEKAHLDEIAKSEKSLGKEDIVIKDSLKEKGSRKRDDIKRDIPEKKISSQQQLYQDFRESIEKLSDGIEQSSSQGKPKDKKFTLRSSDLESSAKLSLEVVEPVDVKDSTHGVKTMQKLKSSVQKRLRQISSKSFSRKSSLEKVRLIDEDSQLERVKSDYKDKFFKKSSSSKIKSEVQKPPKAPLPVKTTSRSSAKSEKQKSKSSMKDVKREHKQSASKDVGKGSAAPQRGISVKDASKEDLGLPPKGFLLQDWPKSSEKQEADVKDVKQGPEPGTSKDAGKEVVEPPWKALIKWDRSKAPSNKQDISDISNVVLQRARERKANRGLILNFSLYDKLDESKKPKGKK